MAIPIEEIPPFGVDNAKGAFTQTPYPGHLWIKISVNSDGSSNCYNLLTRQVEVFNVGYQVTPITSFVLTVDDQGKTKAFIGNPMS